MHWNYRVIKHVNKKHNTSWIAVHEVFYDEKGNIDGWTSKPIDIVQDEEDGKKGIIRELEMILKDVKKSPIVDLEEVKKDIRKRKKEGTYLWLQ